MKASALRRWLVFIRLLAFVHTTRLTGGMGLPRILTSQDPSREKRCAEIEILAFEPLCLVFQVRLFLEKHRHRHLEFYPGVKCIKSWKGNQSISKSQVHFFRFRTSGRSIKHSIQAVNVDDRQKIPIFRGLAVRILQAHDGCTFYINPFSLTR